MKKKITKFASIIGLTGIATATSIVMFNEPIVKNQKETKETLNSSYLELQDINQDDLIALSQNESSLLKEISNKYDENNFLFRSWKTNNFNLKFNMNVDFDENKNKINKWINDLSNNKSFNKPDRLLKNENLDSIYNKYIRGSQTKEINIDLNDISSSLSIKDSINVSAGFVWERYTFSQSIGSSGYPETKFFYDHRVFSTLFSIDDNLRIIPKFNEVPFLASFEPNQKIIYSNSGVIANAKGQLEISLNEQNKNYYNFVSFKNKKLPWDKFFIFNIDNVENNGTYYTGTNRPSIQFAFNLPLVNAINWYGKVSTKFIELKNKLKAIETTWSKNQYLYNEIFGSREKFFNFVNTYLINFANFFYDEITFNTISKLFDDLNKTEPSQEVRNTIKSLINGKNATIPL